MDLPHENEKNTADPFAADIFAPTTPPRENDLPEISGDADESARWFEQLEKVPRSDVNWSELLSNLPLEFSVDLAVEAAQTLRSFLILPDDDRLEFSFLVKRQIDRAEIRSPLDSWYLSFNIEASDAEIAVEIDNAFAVWLVDAALGDQPSDKIDLRELTPSEAAVLEFLSLNLAHRANSILAAPFFKFHSLTREFPISIRQKDESKNASLLALDWQIVNRLLHGVVRIYVSHDALRALQPSENRLRKTRRAGLEILPNQIENLPTRLAVGAVELSIGELAALENGDVVLIDKHQLNLAGGNLFGRAEVFLGAGDNAKIVCRLLTDDSAASESFDELDADDGGSKIFVRRLNPRSFLQIAVEDFVKIEINPAQVNFMNETDDNFTNGEQEENSDAQNGFAVENLAVTLSVELAARRLTLSEIGGLRENQILELGIRPTDAVNILADNQIIGRGELVAVEDRLGVRITKLLR